MKKGDYVFTPRFCTVKIEQIFESRKEAYDAGYKEPTHYENNKYEIVGKSLDMYHMDFAAFLK